MGSASRGERWMRHRRNESQVIFVLLCFVFARSFFAKGRQRQGEGGREKRPGPPWFGHRMASNKLIIQFSTFCLSRRQEQQQQQREQTAAGLERDENRKRRRGSKQDEPNVAPKTEGNNIRAEQVKANKTWFIPAEWGECLPSKSLPSLSSSSPAS